MTRRRRQPPRVARIRLGADREQVGLRLTHAKPLVRERSKEDERNHLWLILTELLPSSKISVWFASERLYRPELFWASTHLASAAPRVPTRTLRSLRRPTFAS